MRPQFRLEWPGEEGTGRLKTRLSIFRSCLLITAGSPIHTSKSNSASSRWNRLIYSVASIPTRTCRSTIGENWSWL